MTTPSKYRKTFFAEMLLAGTVAAVSLMLNALDSKMAPNGEGPYDHLMTDINRRINAVNILKNYLLPLYLVINFIRLAYFKFRKMTPAIELLGAAVVLSALMFYWHLMLGTESVDRFKEGWIIYPPLSALPALDGEEKSMLVQERNWMLLKITGLLAASLAVTIITFKRSRQKPAL